MAAAMTPDAFFDGVLALITAWVAWRAVTSRDVFQAVVLFVVFGLLMALVWLRLSAPDVALAEAAVGAGLTGVLFLETLGRVRRAEDVAPDSGHRRRPWTRRIQGVPLGIVAAALVVTVVALSPTGNNVAPLVAARMVASGVTNPVTAVLLNFRAYDTLLEIAVLFLAVAATFSLYPREEPSPAATAPMTRVPEQEMMLEWFVTRLAPVMFLTGCYLWWRGSSAPGGAFQGGAVLAALFALLLVTGFQYVPSPRSLMTRLLIAGGLFCFTAVAAAGLVTGSMFLDYPPGWAKPLILVIEASLTVSVAASLAALVVGVPSEPPRRDGARG